MTDLRSSVEISKEKIRSYQRTIRILLIIIVILIAMSLSLGFCSYRCISSPVCPNGTPTETPGSVVTLTPLQPETPTGTSETTTPNTTYTPEPDLDATATAACSEFMDEFPGTPCP